MIKPAGHTFLLKNEIEGEQKVVFMRKDENGKIVHDGTRNEEVIEMMINRMEHLQGILPCAENVKTIEALKVVLEQFDIRTAKRVRQGIKGQNKQHI